MNHFIFILSDMRRKGTAGEWGPTCCPPPSSGHSSSTQGWTTQAQEQKETYVSPLQETLPGWHGHRAQLPGVCSEQRQPPSHADMRPHGRSELTRLSSTTGLPRPPRNAPAFLKNTGAWCNSLMSKPTWAQETIHGGRCTSYANEHWIVLIAV